MQLTAILCLSIFLVQVSSAEERTDVADEKARQVVPPAIDPGVSILALTILVTLKVLSLLAVSAVFEFIRGRGDDDDEESKEEDDKKVYMAHKGYDDDDKGYGHHKGYGDDDHKGYGGHKGYGKGYDDDDHKGYRKGYGGGYKGHRHGYRKGPSYGYRKGYGHR